MRRTTKHGKIRIKQRGKDNGRNGLIAIANSKGKTKESFKGKFYDYLYRKSLRGASVKVYKDNIYIFGKNSRRLITTYPVPEIYLPVEQFCISQKEQIIFRNIACDYGYNVKVTLNNKKVIKGKLIERIFDKGSYPTEIAIMKSNKEKKYISIDDIDSIENDKEELLIELAKNVNINVKEVNVKNIPRPCKEEVEKYLKLWDSLENYVLQESSLDKLFFNTYPENKDINDVLIKASSLNDFYSTNIFSIFPVAKHIFNLNIDERLKNGDETLVNDIANITINGKEKCFYSFATKYCSHHFPTIYPIYDSYVEKVLMYFKRLDKFSSFKKEDLKNYKRFKEILIEFKKFYDIDEYNLKDIDRYLWQLGKEYFLRKY